MLSLLISLALGGDCALRSGVYLLTMEPGHDVQTVFGHSALLVYQAEQQGYSAVYDYGRFEAAPPLQMVSEVLQMQQNYFMGHATLDETRARYDRMGRGITAQRLALNADQIAALSQALTADLNASYTFRYNWYRPNCTTIPTERLDAVLGGQLHAAMSGDSGISPARQVLRHSAGLWPLWFGLHWGSGRDADANVDAWDAAFLPESLRSSFDGLTIDGRRPFVTDTCVIGEVVPQPVRADAPNRDPLLAVVGALWAGLLLGASRAGHRGQQVAITLQGLAVGIFGCAALLVGSLGTFAPFWGQHNLALASPLHLLLVPAPFLAARYGKVVSTLLLAIVGLGMLWSASALFADRNLGLGLMFGLPALAVWWIQRQR